MAPGTEHTVKSLYRFGPFRVDPEKELLLREDEAVPLAPKAFQVLLVLMQHKKQVVTKDDLLKTVWPDTFVEEANLSRNVFLLRKALGEDPQDHQYIVTVPGRGYRFAGDVQLVREQPVEIVAAQHATVQVQVKEARPWGWIAFAALLTVAAGACATWFLVQRRPVLTVKDTIMLADFANSTGDPVFDNTLRQGLEIELEQSPFLSLISDERAQQTLQLMEKVPDARITPQIANVICQRTQSAAYVNGSIASLGAQYIIGLKAVSCSTGDVLAEEQETASAKEKVLGALDRAAVRLRGKLGESLRSVEKFNTPLEQATTPSLEALQAYTLGRIIMGWKDEFQASLPFFVRATQLDPKFAMAHAALSSGYRTVGETLLSEASARRAYELRGQVSEVEKYYIEGTYFQFTTGDLEKGRQVFELSERIYPRDVRTPLRLWQIDSDLGQYEDALIHIREAIRLDSSRVVNLIDLVDNLINLNRFQEARTAAQRIVADGLGSTALHLKLYKLAFLENDSQEMARQAGLLAGTGNAEAQMLEFRADTAAYFGRLTESRNLSRLAEKAALREQEKEAAAGFAANAALVDVLFGKATQDSFVTRQTPGLPPGRVTQYLTAFSFALAGESSRAQSLADSLARRYPDDTLVRFNYLPVIHAQIALNRHDPSKAIDLLRPARPYELSNVWRRGGGLGPIYVRGEAFLIARNGAEAATEFQKIIDHRGIVANNPIGALARLQLARAYALSSDKTKASAAYQDFLTLWKDADPDTPVLKQAKAEFAKLK